MNKIDSFRYFLCGEGFVKFFNGQFICRKVCLFCAVGFDRKALLLELKEFFASLHKLLNHGEFLYLEFDGTIRHVLPCSWKEISYDIR